jgi:hypothetical protein
MAKEDTAGLQVDSRYGPVLVPDGAGGQLQTAGGKRELTFEFSGATINDDSEQNPIIPAGSLVIAAYAEIEEAFTLGGTTPTIVAGTVGTEATNGVAIADAGEADTIGTYDITASITGTWGAGLAADTSVGLALGGTQPVVGADGKGRIVIEYVKV